MQLPSPGLFTASAACFGLSTDTAGASAPAYLGYERTALRSVHGHTNEAACGLIIMSETPLEAVAQQLRCYYTYLSISNDKYGIYMSFRQFSLLREHYLNSWINGIAPVLNGIANV
jgi:hypothetical protein